MTLEEFLYNLHFDIEKVSPPDWKVDWEDAPLPYKLYRTLPDFPLSLEVPLTLEKWDTPKQPNLQKMSHFLWYVFGLTQFSQSSLPPTNQVPELTQSYRRFVPSGGALYPNELYVYLKMEDLPVGLYHYDVAHHRLMCLREGNFDSYITRALGNRCDVSSCFGMVFVSTMFWKNYYKYNNFSYRLQGLDAGVLIGQLLEVAKRFGFASGVYFQYLDEAINHLLGLTEEEESVYAVIPLTVEPMSWFTNGGGRDEVISATKLCQELEGIQHHHDIGSKRIKKSSMLMKMNEASKLHSTQSFRPVKPKEKLTCESEVVTLPRVKRLSYDLASVCQKRFSPGMDFIAGKVSQSQLATLLQEATASYVYRSDLDEAPLKHEPRVTLYCCLHQVEGIADGAYYYDLTHHALRQIDLGDHRLSLQYGMPAGNVNLFQVPLCFHVAGDQNYVQSELGYRGYRIQQMEAGMLVQRLLLAASALEMGGHPLLGFDVKLCDELYRMDQQAKTSLIQIPIGPYQARSWLRGSLQS
ncbi:SagB family peptide dehydrogenase [Metabacillus iocasae]|uniref:SagB-type dehydrogenase family enzyme n=1 Tax=Priestia iocasae TaxID=2291674 RepID=A0ABS2QTX2_9BACI|nr:SagB family peptide dehydrogenase [Metabacillus iocasae]MBM7702921.1 SagB-type dehydrogenase family enzyme [Metabacillus iocasae]